MARVWIPTGLPGHTLRRVTTCFEKPARAPKTLFPHIGHHSDAICFTRQAPKWHPFTFLQTALYLKLLQISTVPPRWRCHE